ncbi:MAG: class I SAM-dependent methyltransferase [Candidatus Hodarchaeales archaeon]
MLINTTILRDPSDKISKLSFEKDKLVSENGTKYSIENEIVPVLIYPTELAGPDKQFNEQYAENAQKYDIMSVFLFEMVHEDHNRARRNLVSMLNLRPGDKVLEVSVGTGLNVPYILEDIKESGEVHLLDLSKHMLNIAIDKFKAVNNTYFYLGNGSNLPFADETFDALLHVGGINTFSDIEGALKEFARVTKKGGKVVICDEGMLESLLKTEYGQVGAKFNGLYTEKPPLDKLPPNAQEVKLSYVVGGFFYVIEFIIGDEHSFNMDLPVPDGSGKTVRDYYEQLKQKIKKDD